MDLSCGASNPHVHVPAMWIYRTIMGIGIPVSRLRFSLLMTLIGLSLSWGCGSTHERIDSAVADRSDEWIQDAQTVTKIGVIDLVAIMKRSKVGEPALASWQREIQEATQGAHAEWQKLQELQQQPEVDTAAAKQQILMQNLRYGRSYQSYKDASKRGYRKALAAIMPNIETVIMTVAQRDDFAIVLVKGNPDMVMSTWYALASVDLTDQVVEELNRRFP